MVPEEDQVMPYCTQCGGIGCIKHSGEGLWCAFCGTLNRKCEYCRDREPVPHADEILAARVLDQERRLADLERVVCQLIERSTYDIQKYDHELRTATNKMYMDPEKLRELCVTRREDVHLTLAAQRVIRRIR